MRPQNSLLAPGLSLARATPAVSGAEIAADKIKMSDPAAGLGVQRQ